MKFKIGDKLVAYRGTEVVFEVVALGETDHFVKGKDDKIVELFNPDDYFAIPGVKNFPDGTWLQYKGTPGAVAVKNTPKSMYNSGSRWENNAHISDGPDSYWDKMSDFEVDKAVEKYGHPFFEKGDWITHISGSVAIYDGIKDIDFKSAWDQSWTKKSAGKLLEWRVMQPWEKTDAIAKWGNPQEVKFAWNDFVEYKGKLYQICYISTSKNAITAHDSEGNFTLDNKTENEHWIPLSECKKVTPAFPWFPGAVIETCNFPKFIRREKYEVGCASCKLVPFSKIKLVIEENFLKPTIERVAKVITFENGGVWEQMAPATRDRARKLAKAAIEAYNAK